MTKSILILDDDQTFSTTLARSFKRRGYNSFAANSIEEAKGILTDTSINFAVVDLKIDQESGLQFLAILKEHSPQTKALILTGYSSISTTVEAMKLGSVNYLCKPVTTDVIIKALQEEDANPDIPLDTSPPSVGRLEWEHIQRVLNEHDGNISATANALGMHRRTLQRKLQKRPSSK
ncbi:two-component system response regulator [Oleiphilus sp. HI0068]|uniref:response regulator transcription factor n=2 Tax=Oleiphilus TaxID=141450 RepID=UPI0007C2CF49|nr:MULTISPECIES: response regulator transcription factor [unclassified Oleiphilus]KZY72889.1 two-component system response regulator [Oleiphilus sp. HI0068]KZY79997.1 two-component system response regulator [Oleiphilus sp. HI0069]KZZ33441.1 two-component system response regulator [Oleiphilus sp. HI0085]KZY59581.1 two-component system response regulator [Oleiphilus sp. HI0061]KZY66196.1 two-component system response regulator [Oleiphilus sp. HI0061]